MADKTEFLQAIDDAILDADSLEQFINGLEDETVLTRLGATYPTIRNAIKQLFVNGGLPATPFKTKAAMQSSSLDNNSYAVVTDDPDPYNIGLYVYNGGWVKSNFLEHAYSIGDISDAVSTSIFGGYSKVKYSPIVGYSVNTSTPGNQLFNEPSYNDTRAHIKMSVTGFDKLKTSINSVMTAKNQRVVFVDEQGVVVGNAAPNSDNEVAIPIDAKWAYRSFRIDSEIEPNDFEVFLHKKPKVLDSIIDNVQGVINSDLDKRIFTSGEVGVDFEPIRGAVVDTGSDPSKIFAPENDDIRKYVAVPVGEYRRLTVHHNGDVPDGNAWAWYYIDSNNLRRYLAPSNTLAIDIPDDAVSVIKTVYLKMANFFMDDSHFTLTASFKHKSIQQQINDISDKVVDIDALELKLRDAKDRAAVMKEAFDSGNIISPNSFTGSQNERIHAAVDFARWQGWGIVELSHDTHTDSDVWVVTESIRLPSNCWLYINNVTLKKADGMFDTLIRNDGIVPNASNYKYADELNENSNIRIFGNDKNLSRLEGNSGSPYTAPHPVDGGDPIPWVFDRFGWRCITILFANTIGYEVYNLHISKTTSWAISNENGCYGFKYHDIEFYTHVTNGDGINVRYGCHNFEIYNISGRTTDDMIAINSAVTRHSAYPTSGGRYIFPLIVGGYMDERFDFGISNGKVWNISGGRSNEAVLLLTGGGGYIRDVSISDINDDDGAYLVLMRILDPAVYGLQASPDDITNITISNITSKYTNKVLELAAPVGTIRVHNVSKTAEGGLNAVEKLPSYSAKRELMTNIYTKR